MYEDDPGRLRMKVVSLCCIHQLRGDDEQTSHHLVKDHNFGGLVIVFGCKGVLRLADNIALYPTTQVKGIIATYIALGKDAVSFQMEKMLPA